MEKIKYIFHNSILILIIDWSSMNGVLMVRCKIGLSDLLPHLVMLTQIELLDLVENPWHFWMFGSRCSPLDNWSCKKCGKPHPIFTILIIQHVGARVEENTPNNLRAYQSYSIYMHLQQPQKGRRDHSGNWPFHLLGFTIKPIRYLNLFQLGCLSQIGSVVS